MTQELQTEAALPATATIGAVDQPWWNNGTVAIVGGGPSLVDFDFQRLRGATVLAVKGAIFDIPWADAGYGVDWPRFLEWKDRLAGLPMRIYWGVDRERLAECPAAENITYLERTEGEQISDDPSTVFCGGTSGFGALQVALLKKARRIILFGFDYQGDWRVAENFHHNPKHYDKRRRQAVENWRMWASYFDNVAWVARSRDVEIINASTMSQISAYPKVTPDEGVALLHRGA